MNRVVAKAVLTNNGKMLILKRSDTDNRRPGEWDLPGGAVDEGEGIEAACVREVQEEAGLTVKLEGLDLLYARTEYLEDKGNISWLIFHAESPTTETTLSYEHTEARWVTLEEALGVVTYDRQQQFLLHIKTHNLLK